MPGIDRSWPSIAIIHCPSLLIARVTSSGVIPAGTPDAVAESASCSLQRRTSASSLFRRSRSWASVRGAVTVALAAFAAGLAVPSFGSPGIDGRPLVWPVTVSGAPSRAATNPQITAHRALRKDPAGLAAEKPFMWGVP
jgi:NhaP-type Na+/H+ or K+/H+ antiporter